MKKHKLLAVLLALVMTLSLLPIEALAESEQAVPVSGELSGDYSLTADTTLSGTITVPAGNEVTITGNDTATLKLSGEDIIEVKGTLTLIDVVIEATNSASYGAICLTGDNAKLYINSSEVTQKCPGTTKNAYTNTSQLIQVGNVAGPSGTDGLENITISIVDSKLNIPTEKAGVRAISFADATSGTVTLDNSKLYCNDGNFKSSYTRGFSTYQDASARTLNINISNNSEIKGFAYPILNGGGISSQGHIEVDAQNSVFSGWCCAELYGNYHVLNYTDCDIYGLNPFGGPSDDYSLFQTSYASGAGPYYSSGSHNVITLTGCTLTAATQSDTTAKQKIVNFEDDSSVINFRDGTTITQQDMRPALFQVWDEDGADPTNAKQFTFDDTVSISGGNYYFSFIDAPYETAIVCDEPVAKVYQGDTGIFTYAPTLSDAVSNAENGDTIVLIDDTDENVTIPAGKTLTLDLNGCTLNGGTNNGSKAALTNNGTVTIKDSKTSGTIKREDTGGSGSYYTIKNEGTMTIESGNIYNQSGELPPVWGGASLICNGASNAATLTINGGTISQDNFIAVKNDEYGTLYINGGTISSKAQAVQNWKDATISGGSLTGEVTAWTYLTTKAITNISDNAVIDGEIQAIKLIYSSTNPTYQPEVHIDGGKINSTFLVGHQTYGVAGSFVADNNDAVVEISGGLFKTAPATAYLASGMKVMDSGNSSYPYTVGIGVTDVTLDKSSASIAIGETVDLTATVVPADATNRSVTWVSDNTDVATVSGGTVTGVKPGTATVTVTTVDGSKTASCEVTVLDKYIVSFESAQGTAPEAQTVVQGETIDLPDAPEDVDTTVYIFNGWKLGDTIYQPTSVSEEAYTVTGSVTFVAQWNKIVVPADPEESGSTQIEVTTGETNTSIENVPEDQKEAAEQIADALADITVLGEEALVDAATEVAQDQDIVDAAIDDAQDKGVTAGEGETLTVVVKTYMDIEVKSVDENAVVLDITPRYDVIVSNGTSEHKAVEGEKLEVSEEISITLPLPAALASVENIYVRHVKEDGTVYYYKAVKDEGAGTITFTNPHGFSEFTLISDSRTATVNFNGTSKTLTPADVGAELSDNYTVPSGKRFGGWKFEGIDGTYTTLTDDLLTALAALGSPITAEPVFSNRSSGSGSSSYTASVDSGIKNGAVTVSPKSASKGTTVTITVKPDTGYELDDLTVTDKNGDTVKLTRKSDTKYTFTMPASKVTIDADFVKIEEAPARSFADVPDGFWAEDAIIWAYENGYMKGTSETAFDPSGNVSRQQLWMILARLSGASPATMAEAKSWAVANGVSDGSSPSGSVTRQQMVTILYRYATLMGYDVSAKADLTVYPDYASVASYAQDAMAWSVANGIVGGTTQGTLNPTGTASRAQFAVILSRFCEKMV